jgi:hypothetical protein
MESHSERTADAESGRQTMINLIGTCGNSTLLEQGGRGAVGVLVNGAVADEDLVGLACLHARQTGSIVAFFYVIVVPISLPITARLVPESTLAETRLRWALILADQYGCSATASALRAREAGRGIVEEAIHCQFRALFLTQPSGTAEEARFMTYLKEKCPCRLYVSLLTANAQKNACFDEQDGRML